ncbi:MULTISPECIES: SGNH/GDSL hydrolase family protein [Clostridium]|uniref:SGNH hydrolase-type esterase domain-containing protein n=1 Tax=Clostridium manihotivorum TaxID=2320868 RepID=A0A3R5U8I6_9CLOT|nr:MULTISPECIES: SGNH/GDSL hydrolase family protein [Clostridium]QAA34760.1 hypothetical protein C1I91_25720 [Clostridium manihotivorum]
MKIVGFGACLIEGFPHESNVSFFNQLLDSLSSKNNIYDNEIVSLGGFPITRAKKYLDKKVIKVKPDIVILQFGTTDVDIKIKKTLSRRFNLKYSSSNIDMKLRNVERLNYSYFNRFKLLLKSFIKHLVAKILRVEPVTNIKDYIDSMEEIITSLNSHGIKVVVLAPFIQLDYLTNVRINRYIDKLSDLLKKNNNFYLVNCNSELLKQEKSEIFIFDGIHFTEKGHSIIASKISEVLINTRIL